MSDIPADSRPVVLTSDRPTGPLHLGHFCGSLRTFVPVGADQAPMIEQTHAIVRRLNRQVGHALLPEARASIPASGRLPGVDGRAKMSKSQGNALALSAADDEIRAAVRRTDTDPDHLRVGDPGRVAGNVVFTDLDAFDPDRDTVLKQRLETVLLDLLAPIRASRAAWAHRPDDVRDILRDGTRHARGVTQATLDTVKDALGLYRLAP